MRKRWTGTVLLALLFSGCWLVLTAQVSGGQHQVISAASTGPWKMVGWNYQPTTTTSTTPATTTTTQEVHHPKQISHAAPALAPQAGDFWRLLANCESRDGKNGGGFTGYFQFSSSNANKYGISEGSSYDQQKAAAQDLAAHSDPYHQWPVCWQQAMTNGPRTK